MCYQKENTCRVVRSLHFLVLQAFLKHPVLHRWEMSMLILHSNEKLEVVTYQVIHFASKCSPGLHDVPVGSVVLHCAWCNTKWAQYPFGWYSWALIQYSERLIIYFWKWQPSYTEDAVISLNALVYCRRYLTLTLKITKIY